MVSSRRWQWLVGALALIGALAIGTWAASADEALAPGDYLFTVPGVGDLTVTVAADGALSVSGLPDGYSVAPEQGGDELKVVDPTGLAVLKVEVDNGEVKATVEDADEADEPAENEAVDEQADEQADEAGDQVDDQQEQEDDGVDQSDDESDTGQDQEHQQDQQEEIDD